MSFLQLYSDFRTGKATAITGAASSGEIRAGCDYLNASRMPAILKALDPKTEEVQDGLLVELRDLGLTVAEDGDLQSEFLRLLPGGQESLPYLDGEWKTIYKLFPIGADGSCGKKLGLEFHSEEEKVTTRIEKSTSEECLLKILVLNKSGALPTEIVGLTSCEGYIIAKQPFATKITPKNQCEAQKNIGEVVDRLGGISSGYSRFDRHCMVIWMEDQPLLISDFHNDNIMRDSNQKIALVDCLMCNLSESEGRHPPWLRSQIAMAKAYSKDSTLALLPAIDEGVDDDQL